MKIYTLTRLTRKIDEQRRIVIQGVEVRSRVVKILAVGLAPAGVVAAISSIVLGVYALFVFVAVEGAVYFLLEHRARSGLKLRTYQTIVDRSRSKVGTFSCCGKVFDPDGGGWERVVASALPVRHDPDAEMELLAGEPRPVEARR